jgi:predicted O-methyltransferase YrrM
MKKIFSVPLNPKLNEQQFDEFYKFCAEYRDWIADIYFTSRVPPFNNDAMGDVITIREDKISAIETAILIQKHLGIPVSATFNNIQLPPTQQNLDIFIRNFKPLYDAGIRIATIPHTHWMATGQIKAAFPELFVKNTILRDVRTAVEVVNLAKYGFDYINLDRDLMRDKETLIRLKQAKEWIKENLGKEIQFSLLANEGCLGACPVMVEHFEYNNTRTETQPQYFNDPISRVSCPKWEVEDPAVFLKTANFSPWKEDWDEYLDVLGIDVFKMHGRESIDRLYESMDLIKRYAAGDEFVWGGFQNWVYESNLEERPILVWREKIKNCKFDCWECQYCDKIYEKKSDWDFTPLVKHAVDAIAKSGIPTMSLDIPGLTSMRVQTLLNLLAKGVGSYLEVGSYLGATGCAVLKGNDIRAFFVDNWKEQIQPQTDKQMPANNKDVFLSNIEKYKNNSEITVFDNDLFEVPVDTLENSIQMFFYDGPHNEDTTIAAVQYYWAALQPEALLVFDDANWDGVVNGARAGIESMGGKIVYDKIILNSVENPNEWWNGLYVVIVQK